MTDYENRQDSPRPDNGPDERSIRYFTYEDTADTMLEFTRNRQQSDLRLFFSSGDPDTGTNEMAYGKAGDASLFELASELREDITAYLDSKEGPVSQHALPESNGAYQFYDHISRPALYAFESALQAIERESRQNLAWTPIQAEQQDWLYSGDGKTDLERGCVGHLRGDFGHGGREFWTSWFDHQPELRTSAFSAELKDVMTGLRGSGHLLSGLEAMRKACREGRACEDSFGFHAETPRYEYCLRCTPRQGDYNFYLYVYDKKAQREHALTRAAERTGTTPVEPVKPARHADKQKGMDR